MVVMPVTAVVVGGKKMFVMMVFVCECDLLNMSRFATVPFC